jgi:uncharacterized protein (DUF849 family)
VITACLNGARLPHEHPAVPISARDIAADAAAAVAAGAGAVHVHPKDPHGTDTLDAAVVAAVVSAVRQARVPVGVTTGAWIDPDPAARVAAVNGWTVLPDSASVNWHEPGAADVAAALLARGVGVEPGLWYPEAVAAWLAWPHRDRCPRVLVEVVDDRSPADAVRAAVRLLDALGESSVPVLLHGEGTSTWPVLYEAARRRLDIRIGLEDVLALEDGTLAEGNADLVRAARQVVA